MKKNEKEKNVMSDAEIMALYQTDAGTAKEKMIEKYSTYIYHVIKTAFPTYAGSRQELYQHGVIGILRAMQGYNPGKSAFLTYCTPYIKNEMSRHVRFLSNESSEYYAAVHNQVERAKTKIEGEGVPVTVETVMKETGMSKKIVKRELNIDRTKVSFDAVPERSENMKLNENYVVDDILSVIPEATARIVRMKAVEGKSFEAIAREMHLSAYKIRKQYDKGIELLRERLIA